METVSSMVWGPVERSVEWHHVNGCGESVRTPETRLVGVLLTEAELSSIIHQCGLFSMSNFQLRTSISKILDCERKLMCKRFLTELQLKLTGSAPLSLWLMGTDNR